MVHARTPLVTRLVTIFFSLLAAGLAGSGGIKSCNYGYAIYGSGRQVNFLIAVGIVVFLVLTARVFVFDVKKLRLPSRRAQTIFDAIFLVFTFAAAVALAASPVGSTVCTGSNSDIKTLLQEVCEFQCSSVMAAVVTMFITCGGFVMSMLMTAGLISVNEEQPAEDYTFDEVVGTPHNQKMQANHNSAQV